MSWRITVKTSPEGNKETQIWYTDKLVYTIAGDLEDKDRARYVESIFKMLKKTNPTT